MSWSGPENKAWVRIIRVQVDGLKGYDEDQAALVIPDSTAFRSRVLVTLGTPTINQIMNVIKLSEIDELSVSLSGLRKSCLLAGHQVEISPKNSTTTSPIPYLTDLIKAMKTTKWEEIEAFSSKIIHGHTRIVLQDNNMSVMTQAPEKGKEACLPHDLSVANTYSEMTMESKHVAIVIKKQTAALIIIGKGVWVTQVEAANSMPPVEVMPGTLEKLDEVQGI